MRVAFMAMRRRMTLSQAEGKYTGTRRDLLQGNSCGIIGLDSSLFTVADVEQVD